MRPPTARCAAVLSLLALTGCFTYVPIEIPAAPEGARVRAYLTPEGRLSVAEAVDQVEPMVQGRVIRRGPDELVLRVPVTIRREGFLQSQLGQDVKIPRSEIVQLDERRLSRPRSALMVAGSMAVATAIVFVILDGSIGRDPPGPTGGDDLRTLGP